MLSSLTADELCYPANWINRNAVFSFISFILRIWQDMLRIVTRRIVVILDRVSLIVRKNYEYPEISMRIKI
jgi:hypothetical protein